jgi:iron complex outermembrane receptor protein
MVVHVTLNGQSAVAEVVDSFEVESEFPIIEHIVTVANRLPTEVIDIKASVATLDSEALSTVGHEHIQQSLNRLAGVNFQRGSGQEYLPAIRSPVFTGPGGCGGLLVKEDGISLRAAGFCNLNELFEAHTEVASQIEVLKGAGTSVHGSNALHGVVNVITPDRTAMNTATLERMKSGSNRLKFTLNSGGESPVVFAGTFAGYKGHRTDSGYDQQKVSVRHFHERPKFSVETGTTLSNLNQETAGYITGLEVYKDESVALSNPNPEAFRDAKAARVWSRLTLGSDKSELSVKPYVRYTEMEFLQHFLPGTPLEENGQKSLGLQIYTSGNLSDIVDIYLGFDAEITKAYLKQTQFAETTGSAFLRATVPTGKHYDYTVNARQIAPFFQIRKDLTDAISVAFGSRYEEMKYDYQNRMLSGRTRDDGTACGFGGCRYSRPASGINSYHNNSVDLNVSYTVDDRFLLYFRLADSFRAPQGTEIYRLQRGQETADLASEESSSFELGIKGRLSSTAYNLSIYAMDKNNIIFRDSDYFNVSGGSSSHRGAEIDFVHSLSNYLSVSLSGTYAIHQYTNDPYDLGGNTTNLISIIDNDIDTAPRWFGGARLLFSPTTKFKVEFEWTRVGKYYLDPENLHSYDGHSLVNLRGSFDILPALQLFARVKNLTNQKYATRADYTSFSGLRYFPGIPRQIALGLEARW